MGRKKHNRLAPRNHIAALSLVFAIIIVLNNIILEIILLDLAIIAMYNSRIILIKIAAYIIFSQLLGSSIITTARQYLI